MINLANKDLVTPINRGVGVFTCQKKDVLGEFAGDGKKDVVTLDSGRRQTDYEVHSYGVELSVGMVSFGLVQLALGAVSDVIA